jgi:hypothetical protein
MLHSIREAISAGSTEKFDGPVEGDETYVGGLEKFKHKSRRQHKVNGGIGKYIVMGVLGRSTHAKKSKIKASSELYSKPITSSDNESTRR